MKNFLFLAVTGIFILGNSLFGQKKTYAPMPAPPRYLDSILVSNGILEIADRVYDNGWIDFKQNKNVDPATVFDVYKNYFGFSEGNAMVLDTVVMDNYGYAHYYYHQEYQGVMLDDLDYIIHAKGGKSVFGNGRFVPKMSLQQGRGTISRTVSKTASSIALTKFAAKAQVVNSETVFARIPDSDPANETAYRLAYKITAHENDSNVLQTIKTIYVDASNNQVFNEVRHDHKSYYDVCRETGTVNTLYNGSQNFKLVSYKQFGIIGLFTRYYALKYIDPLKSSPELDDYVVTVIGTPITGNGSGTHEETDNIWTSDQERLYASMLWAYEKSWDYFAAYLDRRNIRNKVGISIGPLDQTAYDGAYNITFGAGIAGVVKAMVSLDIVAHEYTHIITQHYRKLEPEGERAALIESFSDIFGAIVQRSIEGHTPSRVYMMGEDIYVQGPTSNKFYLRSFATPKLYGSHPVDSWNMSYEELGQPDTYGGENWYFGTTDRGGEHTNNSIQNHWFYLLAEGGQGTNDLGISYNVTGIGFEKARIIFQDYYNNTIKTLTFYDARNITLESAKKIYGLTSNEYQQVYNAWEAVGVGTNSPAIIGPDKMDITQVYTLNNPQNRQVTWLIEGNDYTLSEKTSTSVRVSRSVINKQSSGKLIAIIQGLTEVSKEITSDPLNLTISGPSLVCSGASVTFIIQNWQSPQTIEWIPGPCLTKTGGSGNQATFTANGNDVSWIDAKVNGAPLTRYNIWVGTPVIYNIFGPSDPPAGQEARYEAILKSALSNPTGYQWILNPQNGNSVYPLGKYLDIAFYNQGTYQIVSRATNICGTGEYCTLGIEVTSRYGYYSTYPNPASNLLNIEIDAEAATKSATLEQPTAAKQLKQDKTFDIRLYDGQGNLLRNAKTKGGTVQFNVSGLPAGIYYLHIYDGVNEKPEMRQIVVEK